MRRWYLPLATIILFAATILRFWQLNLYPPGPHYDEGAYLLITRSIAFGGARFFPIVEAYQGREVLYMYLNAPLLTLLGDSILTLRISSAFLNLLTLALSMALARRMFGGERGMIIALAVGIVFTISFPQIFIARQAFRAVTLPFMQAAALLLLWHGLRRRRGYGWLALGGIFAGGALYTYMASRLFPLWLLIAALVLLWSDRPRWRQRLTQGVVFFGTLALSAAPMAIYAIQKPDIFWGRLGEVNQTSSAISPGESILLHLRMFFIEGDPYFRYNIPGRPYFTPLEGLLLIIGMGVILMRLLRRADSPLSSAAYTLALLSPLMVIPSLISLGGLPPSHMRSLGMIPLIFIPVALGFEAVWAWLRRRWHFEPARPLVALMVVCLAAGTFTAGRQYFAWASTAELFYETDADLAAAARWLRDHTQPGERVYLAARDRSHPTVLIEQTPPITWIGTNTLFRPPEGTSGIYIFPRSAPPQPDWAAWLAPGRIDNLPLGPDGRTAFEAFRLTGDAPLPDFSAPAQPVQNAYLTLIGSYALPIPAGDSGELVTLWRVDAPPPDSDLTPLLRLTSPDGIVLSRSDVYMTDTNHWEPGAVLMLRLPVTIPIDLPPGDFSVEVAWVARARDVYAPYRRADGGQGGIWGGIGSIQALRPTQPPDSAEIPVQTRIGQAFAPGIALAGYEFGSAVVRPGEGVALRLVWQALADAPAAIPYRLSLMGEQQIILRESTPLSQQFPTDSWRRGDILREEVRLPTPRELAEGSYSLVFEMKDQQIELGSLRIEGVAREFSPPDVATRTETLFDEPVTLYGYTRALVEDGIELTLIWRAEALIDADYTVFVHLVDASGEIIAQIDAMPQENRYPTSLWQPGEYVTDRYFFGGTDITGYNLRVGLYDARTGERLRIASAMPSEPDSYITITPGVDAAP